MKKFYQFFTAMLLIGYCTVGAMAQPTCKDSITVALTDFTGTATINVEDVLVTTVTSSSVLSDDTFDCQDVGNPVTVRVTEDGGDCFTVITVLDLTPPVVVVDGGMIVVTITNLDGTAKLLASSFDDGSYDLCGPISISISPSILTCDQVGTFVNVVITAVDESGNMNSGLIEVEVRGEPEKSIICKQDLEVAFKDPFEVTPGLIQLGSSYCADLELRDADMSVIPGNILTSDHFGQEVTAELSDSGENNLCSVTLSVEESVCNPFQVCDYLCHYALGDSCLEGHSTEDDIEWPCNISIELIDGDYGTITPENLNLIYQIDKADTEPQLTLEECDAVSYAYIDDIFTFNSDDPNAPEVKVIRFWTVFDWNLTEEYYYYQEIDIYGDDGYLWNICDTESNSTELGDCGSGHTDQDDIEWPSDIVAKDHRVLPNELRNVSEIVEKDQRPIIVANTDKYKLSYEDGIISSTADMSIVGRTWTVSSTIRIKKADYTQLITIPSIPDADKKVFVTTHGGRPMPGVVVNQEFTTDNNGVAVVDTEGELSLEYNDDPIQGLDVYDEILAYQYILGALVMNDDVVDILDISGNDTISILDLVLLQKLYLGINDPEDNLYGWKFRERLEPFTNVRADYLSYKVGDIDDSALLTEVVLADTPDRLKMDDLLMNQGETYEVQVKVNNALEIYAGQFVYEFEDLNLEILDIVSTQYEGVLVRWSTDDGGNLNIKVVDRNNFVSLESDELLLTLTVKALENTTLGESLKVSSLLPSFFVTSDLEKLYVSGQINNEITSGLQDLEKIEGVTITPNPSSDFITVNIEEDGIFNLDIFNAQGMKVLSSSTRQINISNLPDGIYILNGNNQSKRFSNRFIKM